MLLKKSKGFTLMELILAVGLMAVAFGVTSDLIVTIVRSQMRTQVMDSLEQQANFISLKIEKDLRNAKTAVVTEGGSVLTITARDGTQVVYSYDTKTNSYLLSETYGGSTVPLNDTTNPGAAGVICSTGYVCFESEGSGTPSSPTMISISLKLFSSSSVLDPGSTLGTLDINDTVIVRNYVSN